MRLSLIHICALHVGQSTYGDLCLHLGIATGLQGSAYPPDYTLIQDVLLGYPFLMDALSASMISLGTGLAASFVIPGSLMMGLVFLGFVILAWELTHSRAAVVDVYKRQGQESPLRNGAEPACKTTGQGANPLPQTKAVF